MKYTFSLLFSLILFLCGCVSKKYVDYAIIENNGITVSVSRKGDIVIVDKLTNTKFEYEKSLYNISNIFKDDDEISFVVNAEIPLKAKVKLVSDKSFELCIDGKGKMSKPINFPSAWETSNGDRIIYPIGNGYAFPVEKELPFLNKRVPAVRGWANSMGLIAIERKNCFLVCGFEKPFDMFILNKRKMGLNSVAISIDSQMGEFGYARVFRFFIDNKLSKVMAQYRDWRASMGYVKTLEEKSKVVPEIAKLRGAANVWMWCENSISKLYGRPDNPNAPKREPRKIADEMKSLGMDCILWNNFEGESAEDCEYIKSLGFLVGKYDVYRDVLPADIAHKIIPYRVKRSVNTKYWPDIVRIDKNGERVKAWQVHGLDGKMYHQHAVCEIPALWLTKKNVSADLQNVKYTSRLIDVQAGTDLRECYSKEHPATRTESAKYINMQHEYLSSIGLVKGVEVGHEIFASTYDYAEGLTSPAYFRIKQAGRRMTDVIPLSEMPEKTFEYMLNPEYRIPLWELVYHDCVVNYWYWGSSSSQCPELMHKLDAFCGLYGYPPIYSVDVAHWNVLKNEIAKSYKRCAPIAKKVGFSRMIDFDYLTKDKKIQKTTFANGKSVIANFSDKDYKLPNGKILKSWTANLCE
ncbi:MAG: hypothetical protein J6B07_07855 [Opitutales bacterium]|nr:hypothetical protein [Opitutales bacterium]